MRLLIMKFSRYVPSLNNVNTKCTRIYHKMHVFGYLTSTSKKTVQICIATFANFVTFLRSPPHVSGIYPMGRRALLFPVSRIISHRVVFPPRECLWICGHQDIASVM